MGAAASVDTAPGARKLQNFMAMKAYNLRQSGVKSVTQQLNHLKQKDEVTAY